jgi:Fur family ferric uptake transcriptional regulator
MRQNIITGWAKLEYRSGPFRSIERTTIKSLAEEGWLVPVELPGRSTRYELSGKGHHHHFYCNGCGLVFDLNGCVASFRDMIPRGFRVTAHEVLLYGMCQDCRT